MKLTVEELQQTMNYNKRKKPVIKILKKQGFKDVRRIKSCKGIDAQRIAKACDDGECNSVETENYELFGAIGEMFGFEFVWLEETQIEPTRYDVTILARKVMR